MSIVITGATGQLGRFVVDFLAKKVDPAQIVVAVRSPERAADLLALGVVVRKADYNDVSSLEAAFAGASKVLLISSSEFGQRIAQHTNVIQAAVKARVGLLVYTSLLNATSTPSVLADDHKETERLISESGLPFVILRNGWYAENFVSSALGALQHGALVGAAGEGRFSSTGRSDYAEAAAVVLADPIDAHAGKIYELAADEPHTMADVAAVTSRVAGRTIPYVNLPEEQLRQALVGAGLPEGFAFALANNDVAASDGSLFHGDRHLSRLLGHPTANFDAVFSAALAGALAAPKA